MTETKKKEEDTKIILKICKKSKMMKNEGKDE